jgi:hypothetical protein
MNFKFLVTLLALLLSPFAVLAQVKEQKPVTPVEKWTGKTVMLIGAHADDDALSHGTLAMLQAHGNQIYVVTLTTGNVGTQDPNLSRTQLAQIRRQEELAALAELGIPGEHYINLGYDDGLLEFEDRKAVVENLVRWIRKLRPDVLFAGIRAKITNAGTSRITGRPPIWPQMRRALPCGAFSLKARLSRKASRNT